MPLNTDVDTTYSDDPGNPGVKQHQEDHDALHAFFNTWEGTAPGDFATTVDLASYMPKAGGTFTGDIVVPDEAYDATAWNGSLEVPTKNAIRDKIESLSLGGAVGDLADFQFVRKTADETVTSSTTQQNDDHLVQAIGASQTWTFRAVLFVTSTSDAGDIDLSVTVPTAASVRFGVLGLAGSATTTIGDVRSAQTSTSGGTLGFGTINGTVMIIVEGIVVNSTNAGDVTFRFAQAASNVAGVTLEDNSYATFQRVA